MKYVKIFFAFFVLFFLIGMLRGCQARRKMSAYEQMKNSILKNTDLSVSDQQTSLLYRCNGSILYKYDVETNKLQDLRQIQPFSEEVRHITLYCYRTIRIS